jgi:hypothetical protein
MSNKKIRGFDHSWFVLCNDGLDVVNSGGSIVLSEGYVDSEGFVTPQKGFVKYVVSKDDKGRERGKRFRFDESFRRLMTRESDKDFNGITQYAWLKNYPQCEGSPYGEYRQDGNGNVVQVGVFFRELNDARDAEEALKADELRIDAQSTAISLDEETLSEVGALLGHYGEPDKVMRLRVVEFAGKRPRQFKEILDSGDRGVRALIRRAQNEGIFKIKGSVIYWDNTVVGADEDAAVTMLLNESSMMSALKEKLGIKLIDEPKVAKKPAGNPNFRKQKSDKQL